MYTDMAGFLPLKLKRKDLEEVNDDFSDFSLSSPARKIRRLDADLPPIMEEEEPEIPLVQEQSMSVENLSSIGEQAGGVFIEELPSAPANEERAIVLFQPINSPILQSPSSFSLSVSSDIISGFKNQALWSNNYSPLKPRDDDEAAGRDQEDTASKKCLAVVPWVPSQLPPTRSAPQPEVSEPMEVEEMDIEENTGTENGPGYEFCGAGSSEGLHQWQQQHCMFPQFPQNTSSPIVWYR